MTDCRFRSGRPILFPVGVALLFVSWSLGQGFEAVRVWEGEIRLPTYEEEAPDINAPFDLFQQRSFSTYPYTTRENLTSRSSNRVWRTLNLENEFLKLTVLPDLGGRIYSCIDKTNGAEIFYANPSIKFAQVAYRGAWVALGVEFNFPVSHNWMTVSPVDYAVVEHPDGSASIWVGNIDRAYGMCWRVSLTMRPGSSLLEQNVTLYNRDFQRHRFYWWNTSSVESWDDSKIIYPMKYSASHGFADVDTWPVDSSGVDLSRPGNHTRGFVSRFAVGSREPFMGVYHPRTDAGMVHFAFIDEVPGKKIWSWGWDQEGRNWRKALSDNDGSYLEIQAGLFRNQETYAFLEPQESIRFREYYMPVRGIEGFSRANLAGILHVRRRLGAERSVLRVGVNVNREVSNGRLRVLCEDRVVAAEPFDLDPSGALDRDFPQCSDDCRYRVEILGSDGQLLIAHQEGEYELAPDSEIRIGRQASYRFPPVASRSEGDFTELGKTHELNGKLLPAYDTYLEGLTRYPDSFELNHSAGRLAVGLKRYRDAVAHLEKARWRTDNDSELLYHLGIAWWRLGEPAKAQAAWEAAVVLPSHRSAALLQLAMLAARAGDRARALSRLEQVLAESPGMIRAGCLQIALLRKTGAIARAREKLAHWRTFDAPNTFLRNEAVLLGQEDASLWAHLAGDPERVIELAVDYMNLGFFDDGLSLLEREYPSEGVHGEPGTVLPQDHPLISYYRGYCRTRLNQPPDRDFAAASRLSTQYVFPNRPETFQVLQEALRHNPGDATAHFLLGFLFLSGGQIQPALDEWESARSLNPAIPTLHRNLGYTHLFGHSDPVKALESFLEGLRIDPLNADLYMGADQAMSLLGRSPEERAAVLSRYPREQRLPSAVLLKLAIALAESGQFDAAEALFRRGVFIREEFGTNPNLVYQEILLQKALASSRQGKCEAASTAVAALGKPVEGLPFTEEGAGRFLNEARTRLILGEIENGCGRPDVGRAHLAAAASRRGSRELLFGLMAARKLGTTDEASWNPLLETALVEAEGYSGFNQGLSLYTQGSLLRALGRMDEGTKRLREALLLPDRGLSHHLSRELLAMGEP